MNEGWIVAISFAAVCLLVWVIREIYFLSKLAIGVGIGWAGILVQGYGGGGLGRMAALSLLTIAILPIGVIVAFMMGLYDLRPDDHSSPD